MSNKIQIKRGNLSDIPILSVGEFGFVTDIESLYIGTGSSNIQILTSDDIYTHPTYTARTESGDTGPLTGATVISDLDFNITTDTSGHVTACDITTLATRNLTLADLGYTGTTDANTYVHPTHPGDDFSVDTGSLTGATVVSDIDINVTTDTLGHVTDANATVATRNLTLADLGYTGTTDANTYVHPTHPGDDASVDTGALTGATVISDLDFNVTTDTLGHVTDANATVGTRTLTLANLGYTGDTNAQANVATNISWTAGTTSGPICNSSTGSDSAIPVASASASGVVTTTTQTFAGAKTFSDSITVDSVNLSYQENLDVDSSLSEVIAQVPSMTYTAVFFDYSIKKGSNLRAGTVTATHDGTSVVYQESSTTDLGSTTGVVLYTDLSGGYIRLMGIVPDDDWTIKTFVRGI